MFLSNISEDLSSTSDLFQNFTNITEYRSADLTTATNNFRRATKNFAILQKAKAL